MLTGWQPASLCPDQSWTGWRRTYGTGHLLRRNWYRDVLAEGEHAGASDYFVALGAPLHAHVTGDVAYVVVPATMIFKLRGKQMTQSGATFTTALRRVGGDWRITSWAWAKGQSAT
jgi:hypothetical protein